MLENNATRVKRYVEQFTEYGKPFYIIVDGRGANILGRNDGTDAEISVEEAAEKLESTLTKLYRDNDRCKATVKVFDELPKGSKKLTAKTEADISIPCCFKPDILPEGYTERQLAYMQFNGMNGGGNDAIMKRLDEMQTKIELLSAEDDEEIEEEAEPASFGSVIAGMIQNSPQLQNLFINILANTFTGTIMKPQPQQQAARPQNLAGIDEIPATEQEQGERIATALQALFSKGVTIEHIEKLAAMPAEKIKALLIML